MAYRVHFRQGAAAICGTLGSRRLSPKEANVTCRRCRDVLARRQADLEERERERAAKARRVVVNGIIQPTAPGRTLPRSEEQANKARAREMLGVSTSRILYPDNGLAN